MALLRIDVQTTAGVQLGAGPITSATGWKMTNRLDRAGEFSFQMSVSDPQYSYLTNRVLVRAWQMVGGTMTQLGVGIVDSIIEDSKANPSVATVSGANLMRELTWRSVKGLLISEPGYVSPDDVHRVDLDSGGSGTEASPNNYQAYPNLHDGNVGTHQDISHTSKYQLTYVGYSRAFGEMKFNIRTLNTTVPASITVVQYFNGTGWVDLTFATNNYVDGTFSTLTMGKNGSITWNVPTDWVPLVQNCIATGATPDNNLNDYWVRFKVDPGTYQTVDINEITLKTDVETLTGAALIMALAPAGWTLTGYTTTLTAVYLQMSDETILDALIELSNITGEHFRLSGTGTARQIEWIRVDATDSGVIAMRNGDPESLLADSSRAILTEFQTTTDSYDLVSRVIPYGAGSGSARLTLEQTTRIAPAGYTLNAASNYIKFDATEVTYGQVEKVQVYSNISPTTSGSADTIAAANALFDAAYYWLSLNATVNLSYAVIIHGLTASLKPGDTLHIVWLEVVDGVAIRNVDTSLIMLEIASMVDQSGTYSAALTVSNQPFFPPTEADVIAKLSTHVKHIGAFPQSLPLASIATGDVAIQVKPTAHLFGGLDF